MQAKKLNTSKKSNKKIKNMETKTSVKKAKVLLRLLEQKKQHVMIEAALNNFYTPKSFKDFTP